MMLNCVERSGQVSSLRRWNMTVTRPAIDGSRRSALAT